MRIIVLLLIVGVTLCAASQRKKRDTWHKLAKREEANLCEARGPSGKTPPWMSVCDGGNKCIFTDWICDGEPDCADRSDEDRPECEDDEGADLCEKIDKNGVVPYWMRVCEDQAKCIFEDWVCDEEQDCFDGSDEDGCDPNETPINLCDYLGTPGSDDWLKQCKSGDDCILVDWMCDKEEDCKDGSDEKKNICKDIWDTLTGPYRSGKK